MYADSKNCTDPKVSGPLGCLIHLVSKLESRSLSELTRQIAPPTENGHAPPSTESRKRSQSVNPFGVWACGAAAVKSDPATLDKRKVRTQASVSSSPSDSLNGLILRSTKGRKAWLYIGGISNKETTTVMILVTLNRKSSLANNLKLKNIRL
ncbi:hypothetical protein HHI36_023745 [Cryptolaemus montrouzieri]|uniref:Uncharacterized protein n=1 Tax=Cryptolaemus montrouzieri TaxID=559131 RepID=A0ABD2PHC4_9CUCU